MLAKIDQSTAVDATAGALAILWALAALQTWGVSLATLCSPPFAFAFGLAALGRAYRHAQKAAGGSDA